LKADNDVSDNSTEDLSKKAMIQQRKMQDVNNRAPNSIKNNKAGKK
jgi:hypothetical protein